MFKGKILPQHKGLGKRETGSRARQGPEGKSHVSLTLGSKRGHEEEIEDQSNQQKRGKVVAVESEVGDDGVCTETNLPV